MELVLEKEDIVSTQSELNFNNKQEKSIDYIILKIDYQQFNLSKPAYQIKLFGKPIIDYVINACTKPATLLDYNNQDSVLSVIKNSLTNSEWTVVLFSDTPLITTNTINNAIMYAEDKNLNVLCLLRGFIYKTEYIKRVENTYGAESYLLASQDFMVADSFKNLSSITDILKNRILNYYLENGVQILDRSSVYIESGVSIGAGTIIYPQNIICGTTEIAENVCLFSGNRLLNSVVGSNSKIESSTITDSVVGDNCKLKNSIIGNDVLIKNSVKIVDGCVIKESIIEDECKIMSATIKGAYINKNCKIYDGARILGKDGNIVLLNNVSIGENCIIQKQCQIKEGKKIDAGSIIR